MLATDPATPVATLYSRHAHGGHPVRVLDHGPSRLYEVQWPSGPRTYPSARSLLRALYSGGDGSVCARDPGISLARYFRLGEPEPARVNSVLDLLGVTVPRPPTPELPKRRQATARPSTAQRSRPGKGSRSLVVAPWWGSDRPVQPRRVKPLPPASWRLSVAPSTLGIDLDTRSHEVKRLLMAGFGITIDRWGWDREDVLQEVYKGLLARNRGTCPWDARKSSFGHYVHMVCRCVLLNYARKQRRIGQFEQVGVWGTGAAGGERDYQCRDAAEVAVATPGESVLGIEDPVSHELAMDSLEFFVASTRRPEADLAVRVLPLVAAGYRRGEIATALGEEPTRVSKALSLIRTVSREWAADDEVGVRG